MGYMNNTAGAGREGRIYVAARTANTTITPVESGCAFTNTGATGAVVFALPPALPGLRYTFGVGAAQALRIDPNGTETVSLPSTGAPGAGGKYLQASDIGATVALVCLKAGNWSVAGYTGTWTAEE